MKLTTAKKIARLTGLMLIVRDELEDLQADRLLPKRLNTRTNSWLADANDLLGQVLDGGDAGVEDEIMEIYKILEKKFNELEIVSE